MGAFDDETKKMLTDLIKSAPGVENIEVGQSRICFCGKAPLRTFEINCVDRQGFRVKETTAFQTAGRSGEPQPYSDQEVINKKQMLEWLTRRLVELNPA